jgi:DNA-binding LytR/AlgR family response regulator|tara:strand:+ start:3315 stop:4031 length:717 start_codon:yes stop_codon:yes gene_type:complete
MTKIKIGIVEDEGIIAENLLMILEDIGYETCEPAASFEEGIALIENEKPDLILLDIIIQGDKDGIDLAWEIKENYKIPYIFLTSSSDPLTVEKAKKVEPPAYLIKPFNREDLYAAIEIALSNYRTNQYVMSSKHVLKDTLFVRDKDLYRKLPLNEILFLKSDHVYVDIVSEKGKFVIRSTMEDILRKLDDKFFRTHRSHIVNLEKIDAIHGDVIIVGSHQVPLAKNYREQLLEKLNLA